VSGASVSLKPKRFLVASGPRTYPRRVAGDPKDDYRELRKLSCGELWSEQVPDFESASAADRLRKVALVRAVGVVFSESGNPEQLAQARDWIRKLLNEPQEKVRRYAMNALPKLGAGSEEEEALLELLSRASSRREEDAIGRCLEKFGGERTLERLANSSQLQRTRQKAQANIAREGPPTRIDLKSEIPPSGDFELLFHCREGLSGILREELSTLPGLSSSLRVSDIGQEMISATLKASCSLEQLLEARCFSSLGFLLGEFDPKKAEPADAISSIITNGRAQHLMGTFSRWPYRYRIELAHGGHQRGLVREITDRVFNQTPELINDARNAPWQINVVEGAERFLVELAPRLRPDPRFDYRVGDVPAASHPPVAAALARLALLTEDEVVWDPFCGSGLELIECARSGIVRAIYGTDLSPEAIDVARRNYANAVGSGPRAKFLCCDFREFEKRSLLSRGSLSVIITNPPLGRRVPIRDLRQMVSDLFAAAERLLRPGGRLVFANPARTKSNPSRLKLDFREKVNLHIGHVRVERYVRV